MNKKKGMSPVIGAILLIGLTLTIAGIAFAWMRSTANKVGEGAAGETLCRNVAFEVGDVCHSAGLIKFNAQNYVKDLTLYGFTVTIEAKGEIKSFLSTNGEIEGLNSASIEVLFNGIESANINRIKIIPRVKYQDAFVNCESKETVKEWAEIPVCS